MAPCSCCVAGCRPIVNEVFSTSESPSSRICGSTHMTSTIDSSVPRPRQTPMDATVFSEDKKPMDMPAVARMVPEVTTVGNA